jgi:hypothetical protein
VVVEIWQLGETVGLCQRTEVLVDLVADVGLALERDHAAFYASLASTAKRYVQFDLTPDNQQDVLYLGELWIGQALTLSRGPSYPLRLPRRAPQIRVPRAFGGTAVYGLGGHPVTAAALAFQWLRAAEFTQHWHELFMRSRAGAPVVVVPDSSSPEVVLGLWPGEMGDVRHLTTARDVGEVVIEPLPFPTVVG